MKRYFSNIIQRSINYQGQFVPNLGSVFQPQTDVLATPPPGLYTQNPVGSLQGDSRKIDSLIDTFNKVSQTEEKGDYISEPVRYDNNNLNMSVTSKEKHRCNNRQVSTSNIQDAERESSAVDQDVSDTSFRPDRKVIAQASSPVEKIKATSIGSEDELPQNTNNSRFKIEKTQSSFDGRPQEMSKDITSSPDIETIKSRWQASQNHFMGLDLPLPAIVTTQLSQKNISDKTVNINIGRIEVRAERETVPARKVSSPSKARMSLSDYLNSRNGGTSG